MLILIWVMIFGAVTLAAFYVQQPRSNDVRRRVLEGAPATARSASSVGTANPLRRLVFPIFGRLASAFAQALPQKLVNRVSRLLQQAGEPMSPAAFFVVWAAFAGMATGGCVLSISRTSGVLAIYVAVVCVFIAFGPYLLLQRRAAKRHKELERALPDTIDLMLTAIEAGLGVDAAFALVAERAKGSMKEILIDYLKQVGLGQSRRAALTDISERCGVKGLDRLTATLVQSWEIGASMGDVLRFHSGELRAERRARAQEAAQKAPFYMTIPLALCFMPAMASVIIVPSMIRISDFLSSGLGG